MRAINHALTGAIIGLTISDPLIAAPAALASHFVLDAIPHHDGAITPEDKLKYKQSKLFRQLLFIDALLCGTLVVLLFASRPLHWAVAALCAFLAASPDFMSVNIYRKALVGIDEEAKSLYGIFATRIQWFERPIGAVVEVTWFAAALIVIAPLIR